MKVEFQISEKSKTPLLVGLILNCVALGTILILLIVWLSLHYSPETNAPVAVSLWVVGGVYSGFGIINVIWFSIILAKGLEISKFWFISFIVFLAIASIPVVNLTFIAIPNLVILILLICNQKQSLKEKLIDLKD
ncbi:hypothetical protein [Williamsoniiplasma luminosum]|uniref:Uncharacterized protein n=1 Tax=Williamsoniiplasma luminosum TaxID=214888 RepID=A0A2S0NKH8_9MOLU|nr:hypothetical protein [Williamsoniiplasma luminosum]AVP49516.1 MAG: hypothetical protein C5T88_02980 [Williamsoniiplasma luminosum]